MRIVVRHPFAELLDVICSSQADICPVADDRASFGAWFLSLLFLSFYAYQLASFIRSIPRLLALHRFFDHLLEMPDEDIQTTNWNDVVRAIEGIREANSATSVRAGAVRLDAHESVLARGDSIIPFLTPLRPVLVDQHRQSAHAPGELPRRPPLARAGNRDTSLSCRRAASASA